MEIIGCWHYWISGSGQVRAFGYNSQRTPCVLSTLSSQPEPESLSPGTPGFPEQEEDELRTLGVERFEEILQEAGSRGGEEPGRSYGEEDFECEEADREGRLRGQGRLSNSEFAG